MQIKPVSLKTAQAFVRDHHRHNKPPVGHKFSVGLFDDERLVGVAVAGRPVARMLDDGMTLEVTRTCTDGTRNIRPGSTGFTLGKVVDEEVVF